MKLKKLPLLKVATCISSNLLLLCTGITHAPHTCVIPLFINMKEIICLLNQSHHSSGNKNNLLSAVNMAMNENNAKI